MNYSLQLSNESFDEFFLQFLQQEYIEVNHAWEVEPEYHYEDKQENLFRRDLKEHKDALLKVLGWYLSEEEMLEFLKEVHNEGNTDSGNLGIGEDDLG